MIYCYFLIMLMIFTLFKFFKVILENCMLLSVNIVTFLRFRPLWVDLFFSKDSLISSPFINLISFLLLSDFIFVLDWFFFSFSLFSCLSYIFISFLSEFSSFLSLLSLLNFISLISFFFPIFSSFFSIFIFYNY